LSRFVLPSVSSRLRTSAQTTMQIARFPLVGATVATASILLASCASATQQDAARVVARASQAMGTA